MWSWYPNKQASSGPWGSAGLKIPKHSHSFRRAILTNKVGQTDLVLVCDHRRLVGLCVQDYKPLCAAVTICATLVNIQTQTDSIWSAYMNSSPSWAQLTKSMTSERYPGALQCTKDCTWSSLYSMLKTWCVNSNTLWTCGMKFPSSRRPIKPRTGMSSTTTTNNVLESTQETQTLSGN